MSAAPQALAALEAANVKRLDKAATKRDLRAGRLELHQLLTERTEALSHMPLFALMLELPRWGQERLYRLNHTAISAGVNLAGTLEDASREDLDWLLAAADRRPAPPPDRWGQLAGHLDALILAHQQTISDCDLPIEQWAAADDTLWAGRRRALAAARR